MQTQTVQHLYTMDVLSLISFAMGIVGVILALFFGWLSWKFYTESSRVSETVTRQVAEIRTELSSVRNDLSGIVQNVVSRLIGLDNPNPSAARALDIEAKLNELTSKFEGAGSPNISEQVEDIKRLVASFSEQSRREKALWGLAEPVSPTSYSVSLDAGNGGEVDLELRRPMSVATVPIRVNALAPERLVTATVFESPYAIDAELKASVKFIKPGLYNLHLTGSGDLVVGRYRVSLVFADRKS